MQGFLSASDCDLMHSKRLFTKFDPKDVPHSAVINANVPIYDYAALAENIDSDEGRRKIMAEWSKVLMDYRVLLFCAVLIKIRMQSMQRRGFPSYHC